MSHSDADAPHTQPPAGAGSDLPAEIGGVEVSADGAVMQIVNPGESSGNIGGWEDIPAEERLHRPSIIGSHADDDDLSAPAMTEETLEGEDSEDGAAQGALEAAGPSDSDYRIGAISERPPLADIHEADSLVQRIARHRGEDPNSDKWKQHKRHFFILSDAGKPIFSR